MFRSPNSNIAHVKYFIGNFDVTDYAPNNYQVTNLDIISLVISIISHLVDVGFDVHVAYIYYRDREFITFGLTLLFILFPAFVNTVISLRMYVMDENNFSITKMVSRKWIMRVFILLLQLAPVLRYCESLKYALKSRKAEKANDILKQREYYLLMLKEDSDVALLRVFECFLEAAPQQILQLTIILKNYLVLTPFKLYSQIGSVISSLISMAWCMASYQRVIRFAQEDKENISWSGTAVQFLWHFLVTVVLSHPLVSRILAISLAASIFHLWTILASFIHWLIMTLWLSFLDRTFFCENPHNSSGKGRLGEIIFASVLGLVYIFTYISPSEGNTRHRYMIYYFLCFLENVIVVIFWFMSAESLGLLKWLYYTLPTGCILPYFLGIFCMVIYYKYFHPKLGQKNRNGVNTELQVFSSLENSAQLQNLNINNLPEESSGTLAENHSQLQNLNTNNVPEESSSVPI